MYKVSHLPEYMYNAITDNSINAIRLREELYSYCKNQCHFFIVDQKAISKLCHSIRY